jgi:heme-degrading monooxygenase HmoA
MAQARLIHATIHPEKFEEAIAVFRSSVLPVTQAQPGFVGARLLLDRDTGKAVVVSIWGSEAEMKATEASGYLNEQFAKLGSFFVTPPIRENYELVISM